MAWCSRVIALVVVVLAVGLATQGAALRRLHRVVTLFSPARIQHNFRHTTEWEVPFRTMSRRTCPTAPLLPPSSTQQLELPKSFEWRGQQMDLEQWLADTNTTGFVVMKRSDLTHARVLHERYTLGNSRESRCISWSVGKSFVSAAVGVAIELGFITSVLDPVDKYVTSLKGSGYEGVSIRDVLQMSSGIKFNEDYFDPFSDINMMSYIVAFGWSIEDFVKGMQREREPGQHNHYVSMDTQVMGMVVTYATNSTLSSFIEEHLWSKIGFEDDASFLTDDSGMELAFGTIGARTRDYLRFGWLYLNQGKSPATGEQVVPAQWVEDSLSAMGPHLLPGTKNTHSDYAWFGYGYQWWLGIGEGEGEDGESQVPDDFMAIGVYGQFIYVHKTLDIVIAKNSAFAAYKEAKSKYEWSHSNDSEEQANMAFRTIAKAFSHV